LGRCGVAARLMGGYAAIGFITALVLYQAVLVTRRIK
jgi:hypothetical protein